MFTIEQIGSLPIYHASSKDKELLALSFLRMQEYYESPQFQGKIFSFDEYKTWYAKKYGSFSYAQNWHAFNVPSEAVQTVLWSFAGHTPEEEMLFETLRRHGILNLDHFYLVGSSGTDWYDLYHEVCHALYYMVPEYRLAAQSIIQKYKLDELREFLKERGYAESVIDDELQAYGMTELPQSAPRTKEFRLFRRDLKERLAPHVGKHLYAAPK